MAVNISKPPVNLREELIALKAKVNGGAQQEAFWFSGDSTKTAFPLPKGWKPKFVYLAGALQRPGSAEDYTVSYDGFTHTVNFAVAPALVDVGIISVREV